MDKMGGAEEKEVVSQFSVKSFSLTVAEKILEEAFSVSLISGSEVFLLRMVMSRFSVKNFCLTVPKTSLEEPFLVSENFSYQNYVFERVMSRFLSECFLSHSTEKRRRGIL